MRRTSAGVETVDQVPDLVVARDGSCPAWPAPLSCSCYCVAGSCSPCCPLPQRPSSCWPADHCRTGRLHETPDDRTTRNTRGAEPVTALIAAACPGSPIAAA